MVRRNVARLVVAFMGVIALLLGGQTAAFAAPTNDDYSAAIAVESVPFTTTIDTSDATSDPTDPTGCYNNGSVWFSFTPARDMWIQADTIGSNYNTVLSAWTGDQGALTLVGCNDNYYSQDARLAFTVNAGTTYRFMAGYCCGNGRDGGGSLRFSVKEVLPPANDDFADAIPVGALPYAEAQDYQGATPEDGRALVLFHPDPYGLVLVHADDHRVDHGPDEPRLCRHGRVYGLLAHRPGHVGMQHPLQLSAADLPCGGG